MRATLFSAVQLTNEGRANAPVSVDNRNRHLGNLCPARRPRSREIVRSARGERAQERAIRLPPKHEFRLSGLPCEKGMPAYRQRSRVTRRLPCLIRYL